MHRQRGRGDGGGGDSGVGGSSIEGYGGSDRGGGQLQPAQLLDSVLAKPIAVNWRASIGGLLCKFASARQVVTSGRNSLALHLSARTHMRRSIVQRRRKTASVVACGARALMIVGSKV